MGKVHRRRFLIAAGGLLAAPWTRAQKDSRTYRVGMYLIGTDVAAVRRRKAVVERLAVHGFVEGKNLRVELRRGDFEAGMGTGAVEALTAMRPDAIFVESTKNALAVMQTTAIPAVFSGVEDPVGSGLVKSFSRPGGNVTGVYFSQIEIAAKRLELVRELLPRARRVALVATIGTSGVRELIVHLGSVASQLGFELIEWDGTSIYGFGPSLQRVAQATPEVVVVLQAYVIYGAAHVLEPVMRFAAERRIPAICWESAMAEHGATLTYGVNLLTELERAADQLARVLKGANPAELPVDQATHYEMILNLKVAKALGLKIPHSILLRADRLIE